MIKKTDLLELTDSSMINITDKEFQLISSLIYNNFGINITHEKRSLIVCRLQKILQRSNFENFNEYYEYILSDSTGEAILELVNRITTNYTFFNREKDHFDYFIQVSLPDIMANLRKKRVNDLRIWCAGCSTGQEPYMLAILMLEAFGEEYRSWNAGILATDISNQVLTVAQEGVYTTDSIESIPKHLRLKYFTKKGEDKWAVSQQLKKEVTFRRFNLMNEQFPFKKPFHIIFCRNVMIYFDQTTRDALIKRFHDSMEVGGYFFIGHSETINRGQSPFRYIKPAIYKKEI